MRITNLFADVAVSDSPAAIKWYQRLLGCPPLMAPTPDVAEFPVGTGAWLRIVESPDRAGQSMVTFGVDDLDKKIAELTERAIVLAEYETSVPGLRAAATTDPDGNLVRFREELLRE